MDKVHLVQYPPYNGGQKQKPWPLISRGCTSCLLWVFSSDFSLVVRSKCDLCIFSNHLMKPNLSFSTAIFKYNIFNISICIGVSFVWLAFFFYYFFPVNSFKGAWLFLFWVFLSFIVSFPEKVVDSWLVSFSLKSNNYKTLLPELPIIRFYGAVQKVYQEVIHLEVPYRASSILPTHLQTQIFKIQVQQLAEALSWSISQIFWFL